MIIIIYQIIIALIIVLSAIIKGKKGLNYSLIGTIIWTLLHIFVPWLMIIQFFTILVAYGIGNAIVKEE
jgi:hypothetical protein